jgi:hypothetical protein
LQEVVQEVLVLVAVVEPEELFTMQVIRYQQATME